MLGATFEGVFEPLTLPAVLEVFFDAYHAASPVPEWQLGGRPWERGAKHDGVEQWRVWIQRVAQIFRPCTRNQNNAE